MDEKLFLLSKEKRGRNMKYNKVCFVAIFFFTNDKLVLL